MVYGRMVVQIRYLAMQTAAQRHATIWFGDLAILKDDGSAPGDKNDSIPASLIVNEEAIIPLNGAITRLRRPNGSKTVQFVRFVW